MMSTKTNTQSKYEILKKYYGYDEFRQGQESVIDALLEGRDTFAIMPTGAGKSVCYQVPALLMEGITLVISPLISLMKDQVRALNEMGIHAAYLNSSLSYNQYQLALANAARGQYKIIYVAPERLETREFLEFAQGANLSMLSVDEAHCVSQWGQDFRPGYLKIDQFIDKLKIRPVVSAFTATATRKVREDVVSLLGLQNPFEVVTGFDRENLYFAVETPKDKNETVMKYMRAHRNESGIIYCATRKSVEEVHAMLVKAGIDATRYHAGLTDEERRRNQDDFIYDNKPVMVATNAFGMGIDKSNVRYVLHYNMPKNMESYYQEAGRAGRDGQTSECVLLFGKKDVMTNQFFIDNDRQNDEISETELEIIKANDREKLRKMTNYCYTQGCLREYILHYFGEQMTGGCKNCSNCLSEAEVVDVTKQARCFVEAVLETGQRYGENVILETLHGSRTAKVQKLCLDEADCYGSLKTVSLERLKNLSRQLQLEEYISCTNDKYPVLKLGRKYEQLLDGMETVELHEPKKAQQEKKEKLPVRRTYTFSEGEGGNIFEQLRRVRMDLARAQKVPPYLIFSDKTLVEMCHSLPRTEDEMLAVSGVGRVKFDKYGDAFLSAIRSFLNE